MNSFCLNQDGLDLQDTQDNNSNFKLIMLLLFTGIFGVVTLPILSSDVS